MAERELFNDILPVITEAEVEETKRLAEEGNGIAAMQMVHYSIFCDTNFDWFATALRYVDLAVKGNFPGEIDRWQETLNLLGEQAGKRLNGQIQEDKACEEQEKAEKFRAAPQYTADGSEPNAVLVRASGGAELIRLNGFDDSEDLGAPLDCDRVDRVMNRLPERMKATFDLSLVGYVDANGMMKGLDENERIQNLSGYDYIAGDCVIVGMDDSYNYLPLTPYDAVRIREYFKD